MLLAIGNTPRDYAWGSNSAISELLGTAPTGRPEAELWLGSHEGSPARILDPASAGGHEELAGFIDLPFLLKVLAAASPLSLQAHP
ncbi:MAG: type I phosphomannose isomerase catalytic subunit, partial [Rhodoglobus sp.]